MTNRFERMNENILSANVNENGNKNDHDFFTHTP